MVSFLSNTLFDRHAYDIDSAVMNYTEMEAKVREATNNEPWGASSSCVFMSPQDQKQPVYHLVGKQG